MVMGSLSFFRESLSHLPSLKNNFARESIFGWQGLFSFTSVSSHFSVSTATTLTALGCCLFPLPFPLRFLTVPPSISCFWKPSSSQITASNPHPKVLNILTNPTWLLSLVPQPQTYLLSPQSYLPLFSNFFWSPFKLFLALP